MTETVAGNRGASGEVVVFLSHFEALKDPRQAGKVLYPRTQPGANGKKR